MDPLTVGLLSGGANLLGSVFSGMTSASNTNAAIAAQSRQQAVAQMYNNSNMQTSEDFTLQNMNAAEQMQLQNMNSAYSMNASMANSAYQRASQDMKAAGLNPMMMFGSGSAAASPTVGAPSVSNPSGPMAGASAPNVTSAFSSRVNPLSGLGAAMNAGLQSAVEAKTIDKMTDEIALLKATQGRTIAETATEGQRWRLVGSEADKAGYGVTSAQAEAEKAKRYIDMPQWLKNAVEYSKYSAGGVGSVGDAISSFVPTASAVKRLLMNPSNPTKSYTGLGPSGTQSVKDMIDDAMQSLRR